MKTRAGATRTTAVLKQRRAVQAQQAPHESPGSQNQPVPSHSAAVIYGHRSKDSAVSVQKNDAKVQRPGGSGLQAQPSSRKRLHVHVLSVEHVFANAVPGPAVNKPPGSERKRVHLLDDATDGLVLRIRCEKFVEFIVDESFIGHEPRDRRELFERLLDMCIQGETPEDIDCDDFKNARVLKAYGKRLRAWKAIRELFPTLLEEFKEQPRVLSPLDALTDDAFNKINEYLGALRETMPSLPKVLKKAVVWHLLGSAGHRYEGCVDDIHKRVAEKIRENVP